MRNTAVRALLFLDVDGTLLPYGPAQSSTAQDQGQKWIDASNPQLAKLVPEHGPRLRALSCDLMWATAWMHDANEVIAPLLGLPTLPVVDLPGVPEEDQTGILHWKTRVLVETAAGRPFIWLDDEITDIDRAWVSANYSGAALLHCVDAMKGLTEADFVSLDGWLRGLPGAK